MERKEGRSKTYNQLYDYFIECLKKEPSKTVGFITNKQCAFLGRPTSDDHTSMVFELAEKLHISPNPTNAVYFAGVTHNNSYSVSIEIPKNMSLSQFEFVNDFLDAYQDATTHSRKALDLIFFVRGTNEEYENDIEKMRNSSLEKVSPDLNKYFTPSKVMVPSKKGEYATSHDIEIIKKCLLFDFDLSGRDLIESVRSIISILDAHCKTDPYYKDALYELFPNFDNISKFVKIMKCYPHERINNVSPENIESILINGHANYLFNYSNSFSQAFQELEQGCSILYGFDSNISEIPPEALAKIEKDFPNFRIVQKILNDPKLSNAIDQKINFKEHPGYDNASKEAINIAYKHHLDELANLQDQLASAQEKYKSVENIEKTEKRFDELYPQKQESDSTIQETSQKTQEIEAQISALDTETSKAGLIVAPENRTLFQKLRNIVNSFIRRKEIKQSQDLISKNTGIISKLEEELTPLKLKLDDEKQKKLNLDRQFKRTTGQEITLEQYSKKSEAIKQQHFNYDERKQQLQSQMEEIKKQIEKKHSDLEELEKNGLIKEELLTKRTPQEQPIQSQVEDSTLDDDQ